MQCTGRFLSHDSALASTVQMRTAVMSFELVQDSIQISSSFTKGYLMALFSCYPIKLHPIFALMYLFLYTLQLQSSLDQHVTYTIPCEESLVTEESRSTP